MATLNIHGSEYYYEEHGPKNAPAIVFSPLLYTDVSVYESIAQSFSAHHRVVLYDHRGQGRSAGPAHSNLEDSARDVAFLIEKLELNPCHFVGNCLGAHVGLHLAIGRPDLLRSCVLMGATAEQENDELVRDMDMLISKAREHGMKEGIHAFAEMWFGSTFRHSKEPVHVAQRERWLHHIRHASAAEIDSAAQIFHRRDVSEELSRIRCPVLILAGDEDSPINLEAYRRLAQGITRAEYHLIHQAGYALVIEAPDEVTEHLRSFISKVERSWENQQAASEFKEAS